MSEREQSRFNQLVVKMIGDINKRVDDCFANISGARASKSVAVFGGHGSGASVPAASTYYICPMIAGLDSVGRSYSIPVAGIMSRLTFRLASPQPISGDLIITIFDFTASISTGITITIPAGSAAATYADLVHTYTHTAGNLIHVKCTNNSPSDASGIVGGVSFVLASALE